MVLWHINRRSLFNTKSIFIHVNSSISNNSVLYKYIVSVSKLVLYLIVQLSVSTQFSSISPIDMILSGATTLGQSGPGSDGKKLVFHITLSYSITGTLLFHCLVSNTGHSLGGSLTSHQRCSRCILQPLPTGLLESLVLNSNTWNHLPVYIQMSQVK